MALGLAQIITGGLDIRSAPTSCRTTSATAALAGIPAISLIALVVVILGGIVLHKTRFGRYTYAIGSNESRPAGSASTSTAS